MKNYFSELWKEITKNMYPWTKIFIGVPVFIVMVPFSIVLLPLVVIVFFLMTKVVEPMLKFLRKPFFKD